MLKYISLYKQLVDFHPNSLYLITSSNDKTIRLWALESGACVRLIYNYTSKAYIDCLAFTGNGKILAIACDNCIILYDLVKMGDPIRIVDEFTSKSIYSLAFDNEDNVLVVSTQDHNILFYDLHSLLNDDLSLKINGKEESSYLNIISSYFTKKTSIMTMKFTASNILLLLGRFDDNDPKIFM